tara:strand:+ start:830 stop:1282 length:453 start_codon:yes stop_codon:yes gene_type:complete
MNWNNIKKFHLHPPNQVIKRKDEVLRKYNNLNSKLKLLNIEMHSYLLHTLFDNSDKLEYIIKENDFPYLLKDNIKHYVIWYNPLHKKYKKYETDINYNSYLILEAIKNSKLFDNLFKQKKYNYDNICYFENNNSNKSVKNIKHVQLFIKK